MTSQAVILNEVKDLSFDGETLRYAQSDRLGTRNG